MYSTWNPHLDRAFVRVPVGHGSSLRRPLSARKSTTHKCSRRQLPRVQQQLPANIDRKHERQHFVRIEVCNGLTCSKEGSSNTRAVLQALGGYCCSVGESGCLGECGGGPNAVLSVTGTPSRVVHGLHTVSAASTTLRSVGVEPDGAMSSAVALKERADAALLQGQHFDAASLYKEATDALRNVPTLYVSTLCNWSKALAAMGDAKHALNVANDAIDCDPSRSAAWRRKAEAHQLAGELDAASSAWTVWGRLTGRQDEASRNIRSLKCRRFFAF